MQPTAKKEAQQFGDKAKDAAHNVADAARDTASHLGQAVSGAASQAGHAVSGAASQAGHAVSGAASNVGKKAEEWTAAAGNRVESLAGTVRDRGPESGMLGKANTAVADGLERAGEYLQDKNLSGMMGDVTDLIRRNPIPALIIGLGVGYLVGRSMRS